MPIKKTPYDCCGCTACEHICPTGAITMQPDVLGFLYPQVDMGKCIDCGLCERVCAFHDGYPHDDNLVRPDVYAVRHKQVEEIMNSRSGAMFAAISDWVIKQGGVVYGAGYEGHFRVVHKRATTCQERDEFRGSKYVQSDLGTVFKQVEADLRAGLCVLFTGTPCHTAGLKSYLGLRRAPVAALFLVDIVCHGVPAPYIWRDYLRWLERRSRKEAVTVDFRDKLSFGWGAHVESVVWKDGTRQPFSHWTYLFYKHCMFRHSCGQCPFTNFTRPSDLTLADFWGWEKVNPAFNSDDKGCSLVLVNTEQGRRLFGHVKDGLHVIPTDEAHAVQPNLQRPSVIAPSRDAFERDYANHGFRYVMNRYGDAGWRFRLRHSLGRIKRSVLNLAKSKK